MYCHESIYVHLLRYTYLWKKGSLLIPCKQLNKMYLGGRSCAACAIGWNLTASCYSIALVKKGYIMKVISWQGLVLYYNCTASYVKGIQVYEG